MTCVAGIVHAGEVYIGADSAGVDACYGLTVRADEKVFVRERSGTRWVFGFCGSFRIGQLLRYSLDIPEPEDDDDPTKFMVTKFVDAVRCCLAEGGALRTTKKYREEAGTFLVGLRGDLFTIEGDLQVARAVDPYAAIGCGDHLAVGAMHALADTRKRPEAKIEAALAAAERYSAGVRGPFHVVSTKAEA